MVKNANIDAVARNTKIYDTHKTVHHEHEIHAILFIFDVFI